MPASWVEHEQPRVRHQRAADREHLLLAARELLPAVAEALAEARERGEHALEGPVARAVGAVGTADVHVTVTGWPWLSVVSGALVAVAGALAVVRARHWDVRDNRYEPVGEVRPAPEEGDAPDTWDALSRGEDPTR